jgi:hypothetical protein
MGGMSLAKAVLTEEENALWVQSFSDAINGGGTEEAADAEAWAIIQKSFPRLREFEGCV